MGHIGILKMIKNYQKKDWLSKKYLIEKLSTWQIGKLCNVTNQTILRWLKRFDIKIRTKVQAAIERHKKYPPHMLGKHGALSLNWKGGRVKHSDGYILIYCPSHPYGSADGYVFEHRLVMEKLLGRYLKPEETPHHINGIKDDNRPENLRIFPSSREHIIFHRKELT
jgi:hypothetical protein